MKLPVNPRKIWNALEKINKDLKKCEATIWYVGITLQDTKQTTNSKNRLNALGDIIKELGMCQAIICYTCIDLQRDYVTKMKRYKIAKTRSKKES